MTRVYDSQAWRTLRVLILERDGWRCQVKAPGCRGYATECDHVVAVVDGGARFDPVNLRASCKHCNAGRRQRETRHWHTYRNAVAPFETRL